MSKLRAVLTLAVVALLVTTALGGIRRDPTPESMAASIPHAAKARAAVEAEVKEIRDEALRGAVEAQLAATKLPGDLAAGLEARAEQLRAQGMLTGPLPFSAEGDSFWVAPGGPCPDGHHAYPGGLAVHTLANVRHALALARVYKDVYGVSLREDWLRAAALWHDSGKAYTLRWRTGEEAGTCGTEAKVAGTPAHHTLGIAAAIARKLPAPLVLVIASAHAPPTKENLAAVCGWLRAGSLLATGKPDAVPCPDAADRPPLEAFVNHVSDSDHLFTGAAAGAVLSGGAAAGWERFAPLQTASELQLFERPAAAR